MPQEPALSLFGFPLPPGASVPVIPTADELYDMLMAQIEPELTTSQLPMLKSKYKKETKAQAAKRAARYNRAFAEYEKRFQEYVTTLGVAVHAYHQVSLSFARKAASDEDSAQLTDIESRLSSL